MGGYIYKTLTKILKCQKAKQKIRIKYKQIELNLQGSKRINTKTDVVNIKCIHKYEETGDIEKRLHVGTYIQMLNY